MCTNDLIVKIDAEIARLQEAKSPLSAIGVLGVPPGTRRGRPRKNTGSPAPVKPVKKKRKLSPESRARIAEAVKRRWAKQKVATKKIGKI